MHKRQDVAQSPTTIPTGLLLTFTVLLMLGACRPLNTPAPTETHLPEQTVTQDILSTTKTVVPEISAPVQPPATPTTDCLAMGGELQSHSLFSEYLEADFSYLVYLPPCYLSSADQRFPVIYLLHGLSYSNEQWLNLGLVDKMDAMIAHGTIAPFMIVLPQESPFEPPQTSQFHNALVLELIPWIDEHFRTLPEKSFRGIGGLSRGAAWAVRIGFKDYDLFDSVGAHSLPLFEADGANINYWLTQEPKEDLPLFFIDIGRNDQEWITAQTFANQLDENNIPHEWYLFNDEHTEAYWTGHLELYLRWYARDW